MENLLNPKCDDVCLSSTGSGLSLTVKGILINMIPLIIFAGQLAGLEFTQTLLMEGIEYFTQLIAACVIAVGVIRKLIYWIKSIKKK